MELQVFPASFTGGVDIAVGDVDGDGRNDLVAAMSYLGSQVVIFRNTTASAPDSPLTFELHRGRRGGRGGYGRTAGKRVPCELG